MRLNTETFCSVRIAKDDAILLQNFERETNIEPENIELSKIMEVALIDPLITTLLPYAALIAVPNKPLLPTHLPSGNLV